MNRKKLSTIVAVAGIVLACVSGAWADTFGTGGNQFTIDFVPISGSTNPTSGYGIVNNDYRMGTLEITNDQWNKFQSAYGTVTGDPLDAYDVSSYWTGTNVPTNNISWYEALQFVNYLNTSTGHQAAYKFTGTQGTGDYTFAAWSAAEADNGTNLYRHKDAMYYMPTEDEWVKAAYWNGTAIQTYANTSPGDLVSGSPDPAKWNYGPSAGSEPWDVGSGSEELNGTFDMMGNASEWTEGSWRRGGNYNDVVGSLASSARYSSYLYRESAEVGFRVASEVPEPSSLVLLSLGGLALLKRWRRA